MSTPSGPGARASLVPGWYQTNRGVEPSARTAVPALLSLAMFAFVQAGPRPATTVAGCAAVASSSTMAAPKAASGAGWSGGPSSEGSTKHERAPGVSSVST